MTDYPHPNKTKSTNLEPRHPSLNKFTAERNLQPNSIVAYFGLELIQNPTNFILLLTEKILYLGYDDLLALNSHFTDLSQRLQASEIIYNSLIKAIEIVRLTISDMAESPSVTFFTQVYDSEHSAAAASDSSHIINRVLLNELRERSQIIILNDPETDPSTPISALENLQNIFSTDLLNNRQQLLEIITELKTQITFIKIDDLSKLFNLLTKLIPELELKCGDILFNLACNEILTQLQALKTKVDEQLKVKCKIGTQRQNNGAGSQRNPTGGAKFIS